MTACRAPLLVALGGCIASVVFGEVYSFDDLGVGPLHGQDSWSAIGEAQ